MFATAFAKSFMLITVITPLFLGEVVRTYSWIIVLGNNGFINSVLLKLGLIAQPVQFMFTTFGVVVALVHVTMPVMVDHAGGGACRTSTATTSEPPKVSAPVRSAPSSP